MLQSRPRILGLTLTLLSLVLFSVLATCAEPQFAPVRQVMQQFVDEGTIAGAVTVIATKDRVLDVETVGFADLKTREPMRPNHLFWIASMSKPITGTAVLMLQEQGKLDVRDPVEKYLPEFKGQWVVDQKSTNRILLVPPARVITIHDLLTHTSGMGDARAPRFNMTLAELCAWYASQPLQFQPGSKWQYSTAGIHVLGRIVEVVSGERCELFLQKRIFDPLGMKGTTFWPSARQEHRLAKSYKPGKNGELEETDIYFVEGALTDRKRTPLPGGGLFSTAANMTRFYQMMLSGGRAGRKQLLSQSTVDLLTHTQSGDIETGFTEGMSWGYGFQVVKKPTGVTAMLSPGTFGHGGAYATQSWADPARGVIYILMIQRAGFPSADSSPVRKAFQQVASDCLSANQN